jgi:hypothetical protein
MNKIKWRLRGTAAASLGLISAVLYACGGDDSMTTVPTVDGGNMDSSTMDSSKSDSSSAGDVQTKDQAVTDAPVATDSGNEGGGGDGGKKDGGDAAPDVFEAGIPPIDICVQLDLDWNSEISADNYSGGAVPNPATNDDRLATWAPDISFNTTNLLALSGYTLDLLNNDCRTSGMSAFVNKDGGPNSFAPFADQVANNFNVPVMGCAVPEAGAPNFMDLIPAGLAGHTFTRGDLDAVADVYLNAVIEQASLAWFNTFTTNGTALTPSPLTSDQIDALKARLAFLEAAVPGVNPNTKLQFSTCSDGGADAGHD